MSITLSDGTTTVALSPDAYWSDENRYSPVQQSVEPSVTGALIVQLGMRLAGRPITLEPEDDDSAAITHAVLTQLRNWAAVPGAQFVLTLRGVARNVVFRHQDGAIEDRPWIHRSDVVADDKYLCTLRFMEI